tara:strand:+ start:370 stop:492 length:123 start_codon:yes stop_codon:yes gene_type:complete
MSGKNLVLEKKPKTGPKKGQRLENDGILTEILTIDMYFFA